MKILDNPAILLSGDEEIQGVGRWGDGEIGG
jgi:hypothetical protein